MDKIFVILNKEWLELRQQRLLIVSTLIPSLLFILLPIVVVFVAGQVPVKNNDGSNLSLSAINPAFVGMTVQESGQALLGMQMSLLYVLLPLLITTVIASYSIVGEKTSRTLEPLLATPVRTWELLLAKCLASLIPGIGINWFCGGIFIIAMTKFTISARVFAAIVSPGWLIIFLLWTPLLALIAIVSMVAISSRVNDPRTAQQFSAFMIVPFLAIFIGQISGLLVLGPTFTLSVVAVLLPLAVVSIWGVTKIFQREVILTRWK